MQLTTTRLTLSPLDAADWPLFQSVHQEVHAMRWTADQPDEAETDRRFRDRLHPWQPDGCHRLTLVVRLRDSGESIGFVDCDPAWFPWRQAETGYVLLQRYCHQGYGSEALAVFCEHLLAAGFHRLTAQVTEGNIASRRVLEKNGFQLEGTLRESFQLAGKWVNVWLFARLSNRN